MLLSRSTSKRSFLGKITMMAASLFKAGEKQLAEKYLGFNHDKAMRVGKHHGRTPGARGSRRIDNHMRIMGDGKMIRCRNLQGT